MCKLHAFSRHSCRSLILPRKTTSCRNSVVPAKPLNLFKPATRRSSSTSSAARQRRCFSTINKLSLSWSNLAESDTTSEAVSSPLVNPNTLGRPSNFRPPQTPEEKRFWVRGLNHYVNPRMDHTASMLNNALSVQIEDKVHRLDAIFLRDACGCDKCVDPDSGQRKFMSHDIPGNIGIRAIADDGARLRLYWNNDVHGWGKHHTTLSKQWITSQVSSKQRCKRLSPSLGQRKWEAKEMIAPRVSYDAFMNDSRTFSQAMSQIDRLGLLFLDGVPGEETSVEQIALRLGPIKDTFYGRSWDVKDKPKAENVAYTSQHLGMHMDLLYMKEPPGIQLLHCIESSCSGGESMFIDSFYAATHLKCVAPQAFQDLAEFPVAYGYSVNGHHYIDEKTTFEVRTIKDEYTGAVDEELVNVNWAPQFRTAFTSDISLNDNGRKIRAYHDAARAFAKFVDDPQNHYEHRLDPGQCVLFTNRRVMHGRKAFDVSTGQRWLRGAYVDMQDFHSSLLAARAREVDIRRQQHSSIANAQVTHGQSITDAMMPHSASRIAPSREHLSQSDETSEGDHANDHSDNEHNDEATDGEGLEQEQTLEENQTRAEQSDDSSVYRD